MKRNTHRLIVRAAKGAAIVGLAAILAGCGVGSLMGGSTGTTEQLADTSASQAEINQLQTSALPAIATECPPIKVREGSEAIFAYENNQVDPRQLQFQAVIDSQSRNCIVSNGLITVNMGVQGRLLLGPKSNSNSQTLPVRFAVERDGTPVYSQVYELPTTVTPPSQSAEFIKVVENVAIPYLGGENIIIWVGFDSQA